MSEEGRLRRDEEALLERLVAGEELGSADRARLMDSDGLGQRASALQSVIAHLDVEGERERRALTHEEQLESGGICDLTQGRIRGLVKDREQGPSRWIRLLAIAAAAAIFLVIWRGQGSPPVAPPVSPQLSPQLSGEGIVGDLTCEPDPEGGTSIRWRGELPPGGFYELRLWTPGDEYIEDPIFKHPPLRTTECALKENEVANLPDRVFAEITVRSVDGAVVGTSTEFLYLR